MEVRPLLPFPQRGMVRNIRFTNFRQTKNYMNRHSSCHRVFLYVRVSCKGGPLRIYGRIYFGNTSNFYFWSRLIQVTTRRQCLILVLCSLLQLFSTMIFEQCTSFCRDNLMAQVPAHGNISFTQVSQDCTIFLRMSSRRPAPAGNFTTWVTTHETFPFLSPESLRIA
ncbi:uncharacterized protein EV420DRAFT_971312 [Desarmillaria tabescens]|uniref:Uncharacterized protein n=1 Tax=Armillaria tabescens TaxID=1929756 RepID=A0AA39JMK4_ARMTA|nr:uncharacterized protein EV420DRAFT_971312 [Desarmillaria tabescens]KAK0445304.1 hypothetical protein EV420DRAFT_971312 [Desarmillaria tabescens]